MVILKAISHRCQTGLCEVIKLLLDGLDCGNCVAVWELQLCMAVSGDGQGIRGECVVRVKNGHRKIKKSSSPGTRAFFYLPDVLLM